MKDNLFEFRNTKFRKFAVIVVKRLMKLIVELEVRNPENIPATGAVMFAANHLSALDAVIMQMAIQRPLCFMSKAELFRIPLVAWVLTRLGSFPVRRGEFDRQSILNARHVLDSGLALMMFPEGTRTYGQGMLEARSGAAHLAMRGNCPIVPVSISGAENILKKGLRKATVVIAFGETMLPEKTENAGQLTTRLMRTIAARLPEPLRGFYA